MKAFFAGLYQNFLNVFWQIRNWIFVLVFYFFIVRIVEYFVLSEREVFALISLKDCLVGFLLDLYFVFLVWTFCAFIQFLFSRWKCNWITPFFVLIAIATHASLEAYFFKMNIPLDSSDRTFCAFIQFLFSRWKFNWITPFFVLIAIATHASLEAYFFKMNIPMDSSIYTFSFTELRIIVGLESRITVLSVFLVIVAGIVYFLLGKLFKRKKWSNKKTLRNVFAIISIITWMVLPVFSISNKKNPQSEKVMVNKTFYLLE